MLVSAASMLSLGRARMLYGSTGLGLRTARFSTTALRKSYEDTIKNILVKKDSKVRSISLSDFKAIQT